MKFELHFIFALGVRGFDSRPGARNFSPFQCVQTGSGAHPASYPMGTGGKATGA
jgi:hypothetical protein